jgi:hypothetical protein
MSPHLVVDEQASFTAFLKELKTHPGLYDAALHDEHTIMRFLRATQHIPEEALVKWRHYVQWRKNNDVDGILNEPILRTPEEQRRFMQLFPHGLAGIDTKQQPVLIYRVGKTDAIALLREFSEEVRVRIHIQLYEFINKIVFPACSLAAGKRIDRLTIIYDLSNVNVMLASSYTKVFKPPAHCTGEYYPEELSQLLIVNAPSVFNAAFGATKALLPAVTQKKILVFGCRCEKLLVPHLGTLDINALQANNRGPWTMLYKEAQKKLDKIKSSRTMGRSAMAALQTVDLKSEGRQDVEGTAINPVSPNDVNVDDDLQEAALEELLPIERDWSFQSCLSVNESRFFSAYLASPSCRFVLGQGTGTFKRSEFSSVSEDEDEGEDHLGGSMGHGVQGVDRKELMRSKRNACSFLFCGLSNRND